MDYTQIKYEEDDDIRIISFNRPEAMNCVGPLTHRELIDAWSRFNADEKAKVAVLTGSGDKAFCSGGDLKDPPVSAAPEEIAAHNQGERPGYLGPSRWTDIYKPIIAAVNGVAYAGGLEWACFADIRIAEEHASFGVTCRRWNIGLADGGTQRLPRLIGMGRAMELIITGRVIDVYEAERIKNNFVPNKLKPWIEARKKYRLSYAQIQMARELGLNPKKFDGLANHEQQQWKTPLPDFIEHLYQKHFGKPEPDDVRSIEEKEKEKRAKKEARRKLKTAEET